MAMMFGVEHFNGGGAVNGGIGTLVRDHRLRVCPVERELRPVGPLGCGHAGDDGNGDKGCHRQNNGLEPLDGVNVDVDSDLVLLVYISDREVHLHGKISPSSRKRKSTVTDEKSKVVSTRRI